MQISDFVRMERIWTVRKFLNDRAYEKWMPYDVSIFRGNLLLNEGITEWLNLIIGAGGVTAFNNGNSYLAVGDGGPSALTGTVTLTNGSTSVTGSSTLFTTELAVGDYVYLNTQKTQLGKVASISSNTALTLTANYGGTTGSGAASKILNEAAAQTDLQASTNKLYKAMSATYPQVSGQTITWRSAMGSSDANFDWMEFSVANGSSGSAKNANRKVSAQGTKVSGQTWTLDLTITLS